MADATVCKNHLNELYDSSKKKKISEQAIANTLVLQNKLVVLVKWQVHVMRQQVGAGSKACETTPTTDAVNISQTEFFFEF